jgi:hypothetical protein
MYRILGIVHQQAQLIVGLIICGQEIGSHETTYLRSERAAGSWYDNEKLNKISICAACARSRDSTLKAFGWGLVALIGTLVAVAALMASFGG